MTDKEFLQYERHWTLRAVVLLGGFYGVYTYLARGGVFANAQTGNLVMLAAAIGQLNWHRAFMIMIPITAFGCGTALSETLNRKFASVGRLHLESYLIIIEMILTVLLGFIPHSVPDQIAQSILNFICSMQYNTFRQSDGEPMAAKFCVNHVRTMALNIVKWRCDKDQLASVIWREHLSMLVMFICGGAIAAIACRHFDIRAIWVALILQTVILVHLLHARAVKRRALKRDDV